MRTNRKDSKTRRLYFRSSSPRAFGAPASMKSRSAGAHYGEVMVKPGHQGRYFQSSPAGLEQSSFVNRQSSLPKCRVFIFAKAVQIVYVSFLDAIHGFESPDYLRSLPAARKGHVRI